MSAVRLAAFGQVDMSAVTAACESACSTAISDACAGPSGDLFALVPDATAIQAASSAAVAAECAQFGAIRGVVNPVVYAVDGGTKSGATTYTIMAGQAGKYLVLHGFTVTTDVKTKLRWKSGAVSSITGEHETSDQWVISPGTLQTFRCNLEDPLVLLSSNVDAILSVTYHVEVADF